MPLASPARPTSTEARTVAVSGATSITMPSPITSSAGSTSARYDGPGPDPQHQQHPGRAQQRPDGERDARADALAQLAGAGGQQQHQHGRRQQGGPGGERGVADDDLELQRGEEEEAAEGRVHAQGHQR